MLRSVNTIVPILLCISLLPGCARANESDFPRDASSAFSFYKNFQRLTPKPIYVSAAVAELCTLPMPTTIEREKRRYGPHFDVPVNLYANAKAEPNLPAYVKPFPAGAVIVKEKLSLDGAVTAVGGMRKREVGYDTANNDWEYFFATKSAQFGSGRLTNCAGCHSNARTTDFVFGRQR